MGVDDGSRCLVIQTNSTGLEDPASLFNRHVLWLMRWTPAEKLDLLLTAHLAGTPSRWSSCREESATSLVGLNWHLAVWAYRIYARVFSALVRRETRNDRLYLATIPSRLICRM